MPPRLAAREAPPRSRAAGRNLESRLHADKRAHLPVIDVTPRPQEGQVRWQRGGMAPGWLLLDIEVSHVRFTPTLRIGPADRRKQTSHPYPTNSSAPRMLNLNGLHLDRHRVRVRADRRLSHVGTVPSVTMRDRDGRHGEAMMPWLRGLRRLPGRTQAGRESNGPTHQVLPNRAHGALRYIAKSEVANAPAAGVNQRQRQGQSPTVRSNTRCDAVGYLLAAQLSAPVGITAQRHGPLSGLVLIAALRSDPIRSEHL
jgi:hypothetical protein